MDIYILTIEFYIISHHVTQLLPQLLDDKDYSDLNDTYMFPKEDTTTNGYPPMI